MADDLIKVSLGSLKAQLTLAGLPADRIDQVAADLTLVPKFKLLGTLDDGEAVLSMTTFDGTVYVLTSKRVLYVIDDKLVQLKLAEPA